MEKVKDEKFYQGPKWSKAKRNLCNQLTTDGHTWIRKCMREKELKITHQFDVWHFVKNIKKKLHKVGKNKSSENLQKWTKSISNHFGGPAQLAKGTKSCWVKNGSALYFMFKIYTNGELVNSLNKCEHRRLTKKEVKSKDWLSADPDEFKALQKIVTDKKILNDLKYLTKFTTDFTTNEPKKPTFSLPWNGYTKSVGNNRLKQKEWIRACNHKGKRKKIQCLFFRNNQQLLIKAHQRLKRKVILKEYGKWNDWTCLFRQSITNSENS